MKPATNKNIVLHAAKPTNPNQSQPLGWDPIEVWRTRVLLPRLAELRDEAAPKPAAAAPRRVR
jgi:hypothetical protein